MKCNRSCRGEGEVGKYLPTSLSYLEQKLEILRSIAVLNIKEISDNYAQAKHSKDVINCGPGEFASQT